jgi:serine/threonine-protein kinase
VGPGHRVLDRYVVEKLIGEGAAGRVYEAHDQLLGRTVALKVLSPELWDSDRARERMAREAAALGRITHPNVIGIYNVFEHECALVLELEYVEGGTLSDRLRSGPLALSDAVRVMAGILEGLGAIHGAGVVHRDLKPANILMTREGVPKIADLGIARDLARPAMTRAGSALGTAEYMSPEQIRGETVGPPTDVYACGILLYELVTGAVPFAHKSEFEVMTAHLERAPNLVLLQSKAPALLVHVVARALAKAPEHRFPTAREMRGALLKSSQRHKGSSRSAEDPRRAGKVGDRPSPGRSPLELARQGCAGAEKAGRAGALVAASPLGETLSSHFSPRGKSRLGRNFPLVVVLIMLALFLALLFLGLVLIGLLRFDSNHLLMWRSWAEPPRWAPMWEL